MQTRHLLNSKKYFLLFTSLAFFFVLNIRAAEDEMFKIKPIKANVKSFEEYKAKLNQKNFSFDINNPSAINCQGDKPQKSYKKSRNLEKSLRKTLANYYEKIEKEDYEEAKAILGSFNDKFEKLKSYDRSIIYYNWAYLYILDQDTYTAMEFYLKAINEPRITEPLRNAAIKTCEQLKMALIN